MKRVIAVLLLVVILLGLTACDLDQGFVTCGDRFIEECGFCVIEQVGDYGALDVHLVYDIDTGVEYLVAFDGDKMSICPYYNSDGTVAIYNGK